MADPGGETILVLAPIGRDAEAATMLLGRDGLRTRTCRTADELCACLHSDTAGAVIVAEEALQRSDLRRLADILERQPQWSDLPFLVLTSSTPLTRRKLPELHLPEVLGNVMILERPLHALTLLSGVRTALRSRHRQYQVRDYLKEREHSERHLKLLLKELNHRVRNTLAIVEAIATQSLRNTSSPADAREAFRMRVSALAKAHDVLTRENWEGADLVDIVRGAVEPHADGRGRFHVSGPHLRIPPRTALSFAMALHELSTNAAKYGALSGEVGKVAIEWSVTPPGSPQRLRMRWVESGGPPVEPPTRKGFGSRMIERALAAELNGKVKISYERPGLVCTIDAPVPPEKE